MGYKKMNEKTIEIHPDSLEVTHEGIFEGKVTTHGNGAKVLIPKRFLGRKVYIAIIKQKIN